MTDERNGYDGSPRDDHAEGEFHYRPASSGAHATKDRSRRSQGQNPRGSYDVRQAQAGRRTPDRSRYGDEIHSRYRQQHSNRSRNDYARAQREGRGAGAGAAARARRSRKPNVKAIVAVIAVAAVLVGIVVYMTNFTKIDITVNGKQVSVPRSMTYAGLIDEGYVMPDPGNLLAVDGSILQEGQGQVVKILDQGEVVEDQNSRVSEESDITQERGDDIEEEFETAEQVEPKVYLIGDGNPDNFNFYNGILHAVVNEGSDGVAVYKTGDVSGISVMSEEVTPMVPKQMDNIDPEIAGGEDMVIALTFDDGPLPEYTQQMLDVLAQYDVKATFFMLGSQVVENPEMAKAVAAAGHQVASHSYDHDSEFYLNKLDDEGVRHQLQAAHDAILEATGVDTKTVRPPGGNVNYQNIIAADGLADSFVGWTIDSNDWEKPGADAIAGTIMSQARNGSIILMHDGGGDRSQTVEAVSQVIPQLQAQGYRFVTIDELRRLRTPQQ